MPRNPNKVIQSIGFGNGDLDPQRELHLDKIDGPEPNSALVVVRITDRAGKGVGAYRGMHLDQVISLRDFLNSVIDRQAHSAGIDSRGIIR